MDISVQRHARAHNKMNIREESNLFVSVQEAQQFEKHICLRIGVWRMQQGTMKFNDMKNEWANRERGDLHER